MTEKDRKGDGYAVPIAAGLSAYPASVAEKIISDTPAMSNLREFPKGSLGPQTSRDFPKAVSTRGAQDSKLISKVIQQGRKRGIHYSSLGETSPLSWSGPKTVYMDKEVSGRSGDFILNKDDYALRSTPEHVSRLTVQAERAAIKKNLTQKILERAGSVAKGLPALTIASTMAAPAVASKLEGESEKTRKRVGLAMKTLAGITGAAGAAKAMGEIGTSYKALKLMSAAGATRGRLAAGIPRALLPAAGAAALYGLPAAGAYLAGKKLEKTAGIKERIQAYAKSLVKTTQRAVSNTVMQDLNKAEIAALERAAKRPGAQRRLKESLSQIQEGDVLLMGSIPGYRFSELTKVFQGSPYSHAAVVGRGRKLVHHMGGSKLKVEGLKSGLEKQEFKVLRPKWKNLGGEKGRQAALDRLEKAQSEKMPYSQAKGAIGALSGFLPSPARKAVLRATEATGIACKRSDQHCSSIVTEKYLPKTKLRGGATRKFALPIDINESESFQKILEHTMPGKKKIKDFVDYETPRAIKQVTKVVLPIGAASYASKKYIDLRNNQSVKEKG